MALGRVKPPHRELHLGDVVLTPLGQVLARQVEIFAAVRPELEKRLPDGAGGREPAPLQHDGSFADRA